MKTYVMNDLEETIVESIKVQLEQIGLREEIPNLSETFKSKSYKIVLLRKLLLLVNSDCSVENTTDEELLDIASDFGFCVPEHFLKLENGSLQNEFKFWNRILKCINYLHRNEKIIENGPNTQSSTSNDSDSVVDIVSILGKTPEESSLGCVELVIDQHDDDDDFECLKSSELEIEDLIKDAHDALSYLTPLSKHGQRFVNNMQDLLHHIRSHCTDTETGPSNTNDSELFKRIELLYQQVKKLDEALALFNNNIEVAEMKFSIEDISFHKGFEGELKNILLDIVSHCRKFLETRPK